MALSTEKRAERAWCASGRTRNTLTTMTPDEIERLSLLVDEDGAPVEGFRAAMGEFLAKYFEDRDTCGDCR